MIISENNKISIDIFKKLMADTDNLLNSDAKKREAYYCKRGGKLLERDVCEAVKENAIGTPFEGTIQLVSGASFPDIVANKFYGIEVKSTEKNHWTSTGSSILESTRDANVERIYLTFGKLGKPVQFLSRPYEECMSDIAVTHYPRYKIDMRLKPGETIFDKMGMSYDELRVMDNPVAPVSKYYKSKLKEGESLWWASENVEEDTTTPATVRLWTALTSDDKEKYAVMGYVLFPEILRSGSNKKYNRYALWLATQKGIINTNIRDSFSAGGRVLMKTPSGLELKMPAAFGRIRKYYLMITELLEDIDEEVLKEYWQVNTIDKDRISQWCELIAVEADSSVGYSTAHSILSGIFGLDSRQK